MMQRAVMRKAKNDVSQKSDPAEREADRVADDVAEGKETKAPVESAAPISRDEDENAQQAAAEPPGYRITLPFAEFWILPDDYKGPMPQVGMQILRESELARIQQAWDMLHSNSGKVKISIMDLDGKQHPGFNATVLERLGNLMTGPKGRELILGLVFGGQPVIIRPSRQQHDGGADTEEMGGGEGGHAAAVELDPDLNDDTLKVFDNSGAEIQEPAFITLGHELIHARHITTGTDEYDKAAEDPKYGNKEEEETIADGDLTENDLRHEQGLPSRYGHAGEDTR